MPTMVKINGSPTKQSKTGILLDAIEDAIVRLIPMESHTISLSDVGHEIMCGLTRPDISAGGKALLQLAEQADVLVIGTPVYRASYTGLLKHYFDLIDRDIMRGRKAVVCATGANLMHSLVIEHQLRPLMGFFSIQTPATAIYATSDQFADGAVSNAALMGDIERAAEELCGLLAASQTAPKTLVGR